MFSFDLINIYIQNIFIRLVFNENILYQKHPLKCEKVGSILRSGHGRVASLNVDATHTVIGCHGLDNTVELFQLLPDTKIKDNILKRLRKERKKAEKYAKTFLQYICKNKCFLNIQISFYVTFFFNRSEKSAETNFSGTPTIKDELIRLPFIKVSAKAKGLSIVMGRSGELRVSYYKNHLLK